MSVFAAWSNGATESMGSFGGSFSTSSAPPSYGTGSGGSIFGATEQSAAGVPMRSQSGVDFAPSAMKSQFKQPVQPAGFEGSGPPPPRHSRGGMGDDDEEVEEVPAQKCAAPRAANSFSQQVGQAPQASRQGGTSPVSPADRDIARAGNASMLGSEAQAGGKRSSQRGGRPSPAPQAKSKPLEGSPEDLKHLLRDLQTSSQATKPKNGARAENVERAVIDVPPQAEDDFENQLKKVSHLADTKRKADLTVSLQDVPLQEPPEHIQGLALREALKEISGKEKD